MSKDKIEKIVKETVGLEASIRLRCHRCAVVDTSDMKIQCIDKEDEVQLKSLLSSGKRIILED